MRTWACSLALSLATATAHADATIRWRRLDEVRRDAPLLRSDTLPVAADAASGLVDSHGTVLELGPRARLTAEGRWWQSGLAPSAFAPDLEEHGWRAAAELTYDLGPFSVGIDAPR